MTRIGYHREYNRPVGADVRVKLYDALPGRRPARHLRDAELQWFDFDPAPLVAFIRNAAEGGDEDLVRRAGHIRRAAWSCETYLQFAPHPPDKHLPGSIVVDGGPQGDLVIDPDRDGNLVGVEFLHRECRSGPPL
jgi:hypothetical protein